MYGESQYVPVSLDMLKKLWKIEVRGEVIYHWILYLPFSRVALMNPCPIVPEAPNTTIVFDMALISDLVVARYHDTNNFAKYALSVPQAQVGRAPPFINLSTDCTVYTLTWTNLQCCIQVRGSWRVYSTEGAPPTSLVT